MSTEYSTYLSDDMLLAVTPEHPTARGLDVTVTHPDGGSDRLESSFGFFSSLSTCERHVVFDPKVKMDRTSIVYLPPDYAESIAHEINSPIGALRRAADVCGRCIGNVAEMVSARQ